MAGKTVMYNGKIYKVTQWLHYRLDWFEAELKDTTGCHKYYIKESDLVVL